jgi:hypothetical protein
VIHDPFERGRALAEFFLAVEPRLWVDLEESGLLAPGVPGDAAELRRHEWACFALYACVRGLVAAGGFNRETAAAIDALHGAVLEHWMSEASSRPFEDRRANVAERYAEYGTIGQDGGAAGAITVTARLGAAAATHMAGEANSEELASLVGALHEALVEGSTEAVRRAGGTAR